MNLAFLNGQPATADDLRALAVANYGHFTSMQVRNRAVRGLDLHLQRLREATRELFDVELGDARVLDAMRATLDAAGGDCSLRVTVFSRRFDYRKPAEAVPVDVLTSTSPPSSETGPPIRAKSFEFVRPLPHVKHVGTFPLFHYRRQALAAGFDDALFVDGEGRVVEGSVWNFGAWDGQGVVWPSGPALRGTMERLIRSGLDELGIAQRTGPVRLDEAAGFAGAFAVNASGTRPIAAIDGKSVPQPPELADLLARALQTRPWQPL
jgi:branched-subunit amino acid aminotransferase/4-amino-4-deoxychorismate lyase